MTLLATMKKQPQVLQDNSRDYGDFRLIENSDGSVTKIFSDAKITVNNVRRSEKVEDFKTGITSYREWDKDGKTVLFSSEYVKDGKNFKTITEYVAGKFLKEERFENGQSIYIRDKLGVSILTNNGQWKAVPDLPVKGNER